MNALPMHDCVDWAADDYQELRMGASTLKIAAFDGLIQIVDLVTDPEARGRGSARHAMLSLIEEADRHGARIELMAFGQDDSVDDGRLERFYASLGFVETGRDDGAALMTRRPVAVAPEETTTARRKVSQ